MDPEYSVFLENQEEFELEVLRLEEAEDAKEKRVQVGKTHREEEQQEEEEGTSLAGED